MKRLLSALILVLVLVPLMLLMRWGGDAKAAWSAPIDGVQARLVSRRFVWRVGERVPVVLRIRNRTAEPRDVVAVDLRLRVMHEGRVVSDDVLVLSPAALPPHGEIDLPLREAPLEEGRTGLYAVDGNLAGVGLLPLELRVVPARDGGETSTGS